MAASLLRMVSLVALVMSVGEPRDSLFLFSWVRERDWRSRSRMKYSELDF